MSKSKSNKTAKEIARELAKGLRKGLKSVSVKTKDGVITITVLPSE